MQNLIQKALKEYLIYGGLPYILSCQTAKQKIDYLNHVRKEVYLRDIMERNRLQHAPELEEILNFYASSVGSLKIWERRLFVKNNISPMAEKSQRTINNNIHPIGQKLLIYPQKNEHRTQHLPSLVQT